MRLFDQPRHSCVGFEAEKRGCTVHAYERVWVLVA